MELPGDVKFSQLQIFNAEASRPQSLPTSMAWLTSELIFVDIILLAHRGFLIAPGIYNGELKYTTASPVDGLIDSPKLIPYPILEGLKDVADALPQAPLALALTQFHFVLLYQDRIVAVSNLNDKVVYEEALPLARLLFFL